jgi:hypothetical protein
MSALVRAAAGVVVLAAVAVVLMLAEAVMGNGDD